MGAEPHGHERAFVTPVYHDPQTGRYVDLELPTITVKLQGVNRRAITRAPIGSVEGSFRVTGSHYNLAPGTYSLRVTRVSVGVVGTASFRGTSFAFYARHSREGTVFVSLFGAPDQRNIMGNQLEPVFSVGPGTLLWGWDQLNPGALGSHVSFSQQMEGVLGHSLE